MRNRLEWSHVCAAIALAAFGTVGALLGVGWVLVGGRRG